MRMTTRLLHLGRAELYSLIWEDTLGRTATRLAVRTDQLRQACALYDVPVPSAGYWTRFQMGRAPAKQELTPTCALGETIEFKDGKLVLPALEQLQEAASKVRGRTENLCGSTGRSSNLSDTQALRKLGQVIAEQLVKRQTIERKAAKADEQVTAKAAWTKRRLAYQSRHQKIIEMLLDGESWSEIEQLLGVSEQTISGHRSRALREFRQSDLPSIVLRDTLYPRARGDHRKEWGDRYSASGVTFGKALALSEWERAAADVVQAMREMEAIGLSDLQAEVGDRRAMKPSFMRSEY